MFKIPLFKNFTLKMREEFLDKLEYTVEEHPKGKTIIHQGTTCNALHVLLEGKLNVDVLDVSASGPSTNIEAYEKIVRAMYDADMGYAAINFPVDVCKTCGFNGIIDTDTCPACGTTGNISRVRRITGYLSTLEMFNDAKKAEVEHRVKHM